MRIDWDAEKEARRRQWDEEWNARLKQTAREDRISACCHLAFYSTMVGFICWFMFSFTKFN